MHQGVPRGRGVSFSRTYLMEIKTNVTKALALVLSTDHRAKLLNEMGMRKGGSR